MPPSAEGGGAARRGAAALGVAPIASSPKVRRKLSPTRTAVPTRTCSTDPSGRFTATVTGNSGALIRQECHRWSRHVNSDVELESRDEQTRVDRRGDRRGVGRLQEGRQEGSRAEGGRGGCGEGRGGRSGCGGAAGGARRGRGEAGRSEAARLRAGRSRGVQRA